jgi:cell division protease FtsH
MKEIAIGAGIATVLFLAIIGMNITPLLFVALLGGTFYYFVQSQSKVSFQEVGNKKTSSNPLSFDNIGGQDTAIKELQEALNFIIHAEEIGRMGIRPLKGVLLVGPPGTGKTLLARAAASYTSSAFIAASGSEFIEMYAGVGAKRIRRLFQEAKKKAVNEKKSTAIIFIDELEVLGGKRGSHTSHLEYDQTLNQLLVEMDGISQDPEHRILVIGATNRADLLDSALVRPGRFDRQVQVGLPDKKGRAKILQIHLKNKQVKDHSIIEEIARATFGFSGAHLESVTNEAAILAMRENKKEIDMKHFNEAIDKVIMGEKLDRQISKEEISRVSIHESGHAIISEILEPGSLSSLTIVPRGKALGYLRKSPKDDQYLYTVEQLEKQIMVSLAGAVAEEIKYGSKSTGAKNDFEQAWKAAREIVECGLSPLGVINTKDTPQELIYKQCKEIVARLEEKTRQLLKDEQEALFKLADYLIAEETIDRGTFIQMMAS